MKIISTNIGERKEINWKGKKVTTGIFKFSVDKPIFLDKEDITSNDVTAEFVDIESRLKTKKEVRNRYITILKTKTGKVKDIIQAEEAIRKITEEIEVKEGSFCLNFTHHNQR